MQSPPLSVSGFEPKNRGCFFQPRHSSIVMVSILPKASRVLLPRHTVSAVLCYKLEKPQAHDAHLASHQVNQTRAATTLGVAQTRATPRTPTKYG